MKYIVALSLLLSISISSFAQKNKVVTETISVEGTCGMCKKRIENAAYDIKGVKRAEWDKATKILTISYNTNQTSLDSISKTIAAVGHTANGIEAEDAAIDKLPKCCDYRDPDAHKNHNH